MPVDVTASQAHEIRRVFYEEFVNPGPKQNPGKFKAETLPKVLKNLNS